MGHRSGRGLPRAELIAQPLAFEAWQNPTFCTPHPFMPGVSDTPGVYTPTAAPRSWRGKEHLEIKDGVVVFQGMYSRAESDPLS